MPLIAGAAVGVAQAATPFAFWWLPPATVYVLGLVFIAAVYIGFSVADGRWMAHCHIAEHHESGMMFTFDVAPEVT